MESSALEQLLGWDTALFTAINSAHSPFWDQVMVFFSKIPVWIPLYALIIAFCFIRRNWKWGLLATACIVLVFGLTDSVSSRIIKELVERLRPSHEPGLEAGIRLLEGKGGLYGFVSSHAANVMGLAMISSLIFRKRLYTIFIFLWAATVSYSRIYVGKHYPLDVICGALLGLILAWAVYRLFVYLCKRFHLCDVS